MISEIDGNIALFVKPKLLHTYLTLDPRSKGYIGEYIALKILQHRVLRNYISRTLGLKKPSIKLLGQPGKPDFVVLTEDGKVTAIGEVKIRFATYEEAPNVADSLRRLCIQEAIYHATDYEAEYAMFISIVLTNREQIVEGITAYEVHIEYGIVYVG